MAKRITVCAGIDTGKRKLDVAIDGNGEPLQVEGPSVVRLPEATLVVPEGWRGRTDATGTLVLERAR